MKKFFLSSLLLLVPHLALAGATPDAEQILSDAARGTNVFVADTAPFLLESSFSMQVQVPTDGHLTIRWASNNRFVRHVDSGGFQQTEIRKGESLFTSRNLPFTPQRVTELISLLSGVDDLAGMKIKKERKRQEQGVDVTCFDVQSGRRSHEICINPRTRELLSNDWKEPPDEHRRIEFSDYEEFHGHRSPRRIVLIVNGSRVIDLRITKLETANLDDTLLVPPPDAIERRNCKGGKHSIPLKTPDPAYPKSASENKIMGNTIVSMTVLPDGSVENIQLIGRSTHAMDDETLQTLKKWKFKPAMCGLDPVASDIVVEVSFRLY